MPKLSGRVSVHGSGPAKLATVEVHNATGDHVTQVVVDDEGNYQFHLVEGTWHLNIYDPHGHRGRVEVDLGADDQKVDVDLDEPEGGH
ncbi:MAG: carboxypeptidase-like regulatory domain-containing protein [Actinomycetota bacterium]|nr:carboxypeptidase-like regulatory domain-containing protein [Actinomycetota bacterium]